MTCEVCTHVLYLCWRRQLRKHVLTRDAAHRYLNSNILTAHSTYRPNGKARWPRQMCPTFSASSTAFFTSSSGADSTTPFLLLSAALAAHEGETWQVLSDSAVTMQGPKLEAVVCQWPAARTCCPTTLLVLLLAAAGARPIWEGAPVTWPRALRPLWGPIPLWPALPVLTGHAIGRGCLIDPSRVRGRPGVS